MKLRLPHLAATVAVAGLAAAAVYGYQQGWFARSAAAGAGETAANARRAVPVELAPVQRGRLVERRGFSGTLLPRAQFDVSPKVGGRVEAIHVDIGDEVTPGAVVAVLDDDEFEQAVLQARAALDVATADVARAESALVVARANHERVTGLNEIEIASASQLEVALADLDACDAEVKVATAQVERARAVLAAAEVRKEYATVRASWGGGEEPRVVAQRYLDEGETVTANEPIVTVVDIATLRAVLYVTERDYARLAAGQAANVRNDAFPGRAFPGRIERMAPVFEEASRQMRVEVAIDNADSALRPGMFVRVEVDLDSADDTVIVPEAALVTRGDGQGVFVVDANDRARYVEVEVGIRAGDRVQVLGDGVTGRVVVLGQQLLDDGARVRVPEPLVPDATDGTDDAARE